MLVKYNEKEKTMKIKRMAAGFLAVAMFASMALTPAWAEELTDSVVANDLTDTASDEPSDTDVLDEDENPNPPQLFTDTAAEGSASLGAEDDGTSVETAEDEPKEEGNTVSITTQGDSGSSLQADSNDKTAATQITASVESTYTLVVPENVSMTGADGTGEKSASILVLLKGDIPEGKAVYVTTDASPMQRTGSKDAPMSVMASKTQWNRSELLGDGTSSDYSATATLTPGDWLGTVVFNCLLNKATIYNKFTDSDPFSILEDGETSDGKTFESSNEAVAKVDANGTVTIVGLGTANITVRYIDENGAKQEYIEVINVKVKPQIALSAITSSNGPLATEYNNGHLITTISIGNYEVPEEATKYYIYDPATKEADNVAFVVDDELKVTNKDGGQLTSTSQMSMGCYYSYNPEKWFNSVTIINFDSIDTSNVTSMEYLLHGFRNAKTVTGLENFNTQNVHKINDAFSDCGIETLDFSNWTIKNLTYLQGTFSKSKSLKTIVGLDNWNISNATSIERLFEDCSLLETISGIENWNTSKVTTMEYCFRGCSSLKEIPDIGNWNVSNVTKMNSMFSACSTIKTLPNLNRWNTSKVTDLTYTFSSCSSLSSVNGIEAWNTENVTSLRGLFGGCESLTQISNLGGWNTQNVREMESTFKGCSKLENIDGIENWDTSKVTTMKYLFYECYKLKSLPDIGKWNTSQVKTMYHLFACCESLSELPDIGNWNTSNVTNMSCMFVECSSISKLPNLNGWDTHNVTDMGMMFSKCKLLSDLTGVENWDTSNVKDMYGMFSGCTALKDLTALTLWNTQSLTDMERLFGSNLYTKCESLTTLKGLENWNVSNVKKMDAAFEECSSLTDISALSKWDTSNVTSMGSVFSECHALADLSPLANWNTSNVTYMGGTFVECFALSDLSAIANWDTSHVESMSRMFYDCRHLENATPIKNWDISAVTNRSSMFYRCPCGDIFASAA